MSADQNLTRDLDQIEGRAGSMLQGVESRAAFMAAGFRALPLLAVVPAVFVLAQLMRWAGGGEPALLPLPFVLLLSLFAPGIPAARAAAAPACTSGGGCTRPHSAQRAHTAYVGRPSPRPCG